MPRLPLPTLADGRAPVISSGFGPRKGTPPHKGADLTYRALPTDPPYKGHYTAMRSREFFSPPVLPVVATEDGEVVQAGIKRGIGGDVWLHHKASGRVTRYAHLSRVAVKVGQQVTQGQPLGIWGAGHGTPFIHLHFELLTAGKKDSQEDPAPYLASADAGPAGEAGSSASSAASSATTRATTRGGLAWLLILIGALVSTRS